MPILEASNEIDDMQPLRLEHVKLYELYAPLFKAGMVKVTGRPVLAVTAILFLRPPAAPICNAAKQIRLLIRLGGVS